MPRLSPPPINSFAIKRKKIRLTKKEGNTILVLRRIKGMFNNTFSWNLKSSNLQIYLTGNGWFEIKHVNLFRNFSSSTLRSVVPI